MFRIVWQNLTSAWPIREQRKDCLAARLETDSDGAWQIQEDERPDFHPPHSLATLLACG